MKWLPEECKRGDMVRVRIGEVYHYGIFVSEDEIIQFGRPPSYYTGEHKDEPVIVLRTNACDFLMGGILETGIPDRKEKKTIFKPETIVGNARAKLGEGGYNILHNNCEHFAYLCAFGKKYSEQEEKLREKWQNRPRFSVYVSFESEETCDCKMPHARKKEIDLIQSEDLKKQKIHAWNLLSFALRDGMNLDSDKVKFKKAKSGKWTAKECNFSLSHTDGAVAVVVSNAPCGIDIENLADFKKKCEKDGFPPAFAKKIGANTTEPTELLKIWTGKESVYKENGEGIFAPAKITLDGKDVKHLEIGDYLLAVSGESLPFLLLYRVENGRTIRIGEVTL